MTTVKAFFLQATLPWYLRWYAIAPLALFYYAVTGLLLALPPGPLCDAGMILFMEGGYDYGNTNMFFHGKLTLLLVVNLSFLIAIRKRINAQPFILQLLMLLFLAFLQRNNLSSDTYYSHPTGTAGQMILEIVAFAFFGLMLLKNNPALLRDNIATATLAYNCINILVFYSGLSIAPHWSWWHTAYICGFLCALGLLAQVLPSLGRQRASAR